MIFVDGYGKDALEVMRKYSFVSGLTTNPSILRKHGVGFEEALRSLNSLEGLHFIQVSLREDSWLKLFRDPEVKRERFVVKVGWEHVRSCEIAKILKDLGFRVCATAVYDEIQVLSALECGVDFVAVYFDRMKRAGMSPEDLIEFSSRFLRTLVASLKGRDQLVAAARAGATDFTVPAEVFHEVFKTDFPHRDLEVFEEDFRM